MKKRSAEEVEEILRAFANGMSIPAIAKKYTISQSAFYRLLKVSRGEHPDRSKYRETSKIAKLEKALAEREKEISLLKAALKKS